MYHEFLRDQYLCVSMSRVVVKCLYWTVVPWALGSKFVLVNLKIVFPAEITDYLNVHQPLGQHMHMVFRIFCKGQEVVGAGKRTSRSCLSTSLIVCKPMCMSHKPLSYLLTAVTKHPNNYNWYHHFGFGWHGDVVLLHSQSIYKSGISFTCLQLWFLIILNGCMACTMQVCVGSCISAIVSTAAAWTASCHAETCWPQFVHSSLCWS